MTAVDLHRTVPLRVVEDLPDHDPATPGEAQLLVHSDGEPAGFIFACPGCGAPVEFRSAQSTHAVCAYCRSTVVRDGDVLTSVDGNEVTSLDQLRSLLSAPAVATTGNMVLGVVHEGASRPVDVKVDLGTAVGLDKTNGFFGVGQERIPDKMGVLEAVPETFKWFGETTKLASEVYGSRGRR